MQKNILESELVSAIAELDKVRREWLNRQGVTAVDVGYKITSDKFMDILAIRVHVKRKLPSHAISNYELFPNRLGKFSVDVIEADFAAVGLLKTEKPLKENVVNRCHPLDPLVGGISIGHPSITAGTLGAIVWDRTDGEICILSSWHTLCGSTTCTAGEPIYQPARADGGGPPCQVAVLKRWRLDKEIDAGLAALNSGRRYSRDILGLNPISGVENPTLGMSVRKSGRTTGVTNGVIDGVSASVVISYGANSLKTFHNQIHIAAQHLEPEHCISLGGDSGSVWINETTGKAVGLQIATERGASPGWYAIINRMDRVVELLDISFTPLFMPSQSVKDYRGTIEGAHKKESIDISNLTIRELIGALKPAQLWGVVVALATAFSAIVVAAYKLGALLGKGP